MPNLPVNAESQALSIPGGPRAEADTAADRTRGETAVARIPDGPREHGEVGPRLKAMLRAARHHGVDLDPNEFRPASASPVPTAADLAEWAQNGGMWARAVRIRWSHLLRFQDSGPVVLLFA